MVWNRRAIQGKMTTTTTMNQACKTATKKMAAKAEAEAQERLEEEEVNCNTPVARSFAFWAILRWKRHHRRWKACRTRTNPTSTMAESLVAASIKFSFSS